MKRIVILGSTGSIGRAAVEIVERAREDFRVVGLAAGENAGEMSRQLASFPEARYAMKDRDSVARVAGGDGSLAHRAAGHGAEAFCALIAEQSPDLVVNALVGVCGLEPTMAALEIRCPVALANKESLVAGGAIIAPYITRDPGLVIPIDSEHFSIARCLRGYRGDAAEIILTASGGPFLLRDPAELGGVGIDEVLRHPTWSMGSKVTVDSAHLFNKGLEVIEAHWLFGFPFERINVVVHPQSIVHSILRLRDGSLLAHLAPADMRLPIMSALYHPEVREIPWKTLGLDELGSLEFIPMDRRRFPAFDLAMAAARAGGTAPAILSAADEVAVEAFLSGRIGFLAIIEWIEEALSAHRTRPVGSLEDVIEADWWARAFLAERHHEAARP